MAVAIEPQTAAPGETALQPSALIGHRLTVLRNRHVNVAVATGFVAFLGSLVVLLAAGTLLDFWLDLPWLLRLVFLLTDGVLLGWVAWRYIFTPLLHQPNDETVALWVEKARPELQSRLISAVQLTRPGGLPRGAASGLVHALVEQTEAMVSAIDFHRIIRTTQLRALALWSGILVSLALILCLYAGRTSLELLQRALLGTNAVPRKTRVVPVTGDARMGRGDNIRIEAVAHGVLPRLGRLVIKSPGRRTQEFTMEPSGEGRDRFARTIENVQDHFTYVVYLNDGATRTHRVEVIPRPTVATIECLQEYPAYTGLPAARRSLGDLSILAGSVLQVHVTATKAVQEATLKLVGIDQSVPMTIHATNSHQLSASFSVPAKGLTGFSVHMIDRIGMASSDAAVYRVEVIPDKAPTIRILYPDRREELVTRQATMVVSFEALDDFKIARARLQYRQSEVEDAPLKTIELDMSGEGGQRLRRQYPWKISDMVPPVTEGERYEYWVEVEDNNNVTGPGITSSEHQLVRVVDANEKRADLLNRAGDYLGTIGDVTGDQEKINLKLGEIILEKQLNR